MSVRPASERLRSWEHLTEWPMAAAALLFLAAYAWEVLADLHGTRRLYAEVVMDVVWALFAVDYAARLYLAPERGRWFLHHLLDLAAVLLPVLRPLRLLRLIALVSVLHRGPGTALRGRITTSTASSVLLLVLVSALAVLDTERKAPGASITTFEDACWWSLATVSTVGYGDLSPLTTTGRGIATVLMVAGVALIGVVTATLASWVVSLVTEENAEEEAATRAQVAALSAQVAALSAQVTALQEGLAASPGRPPAPEPSRRS